MHANARLMETAQICAGIDPVNLAAVANNGDWVSMKNYGRLLIVFYKGAGTAGEDPVINLRQATNVSAGGAKALNFSNIYKKQGTLTSVGQFTKVDNSDDDYTDTDAAEIAAIWCIEVKQEDLDIDGGFCCVQAQVADVGTNAQLGCLLYILYDCKEPQATPPSAIID